MLKKLEYVADRSLVPHNKTADTVSFTLVVATIVHTYLIQLTIPTSSLEKSLLVGDFFL
jgi:signal peptidase I